MQVLLDTHTLLWYIDGDSKLSNSVNLIIKNAEKVYVSIVSFWELSIKIGLDKLQLKPSIREIYTELLRNDISMLSIEIIAIENLILLPYHHRDPFDRMLVAQALAHNLVLVSKDEQLKKYAVTVLW